MVQGRLGDSWVQIKRRGIDIAWETDFHTRPQIGCSPIAVILCLWNLNINTVKKLLACGRTPSHLWLGLV